MLKQIQQWLFPNFCCLCQHASETHRDLCLVCERSLPWVEDRCYRCGLISEDAQDSIICGRCRETPPEFDRLCTLFNYELPVTKLVMGLKFGEQLAYGRILGELLADAVDQWYPENTKPETVIPVPLHTKRLQKRGYNQALELLWSVERRCQIPIGLDTCIRVRDTIAQSKLSKNRRQWNMTGVFALTKPMHLEHIAIMDDVVTTGSTVRALTRIFKEAGVQQVDIWCICRA